jgi:hypothetical protein
MLDGMVALLHHPPPSFIESTACVGSASGKICCKSSECISLISWHGISKPGYGKDMMETI